jgi:hypothetical protein
MTILRGHGTLTWTGEYQYCYASLYLHIISFVSQPTMTVNIHNQCSGFKLTDKGLFSAGANWKRYPEGEVDAGNMTSVDLIPFLTIFGGALTYVLQSEYVESGNQLGSTHIRFFVAWKSKGYKKFRVFLQLIEYDKQIDWNENKLEEYYHKHVNQLGTYIDPIKDTWLINDGTVLMTKLELDFMQRDGRLNITISESTRDNHTRRPVWIDPKM